LKVSFPTVAGKTYQVSSSRDLKQWELRNDPINGTGQTVALDFNIEKEARNFFRVEVINPISVKIEQRQNKGVNLTFATNPGRKYLVLTSRDLQLWEAQGDPIESTGQTITLDGHQQVNLYYKIEEIPIAPAPNMVWIKGGKFVMGSRVDEQDRDWDEDPLTEVTLSHGFWMGKYEVTQRDYQALVGTNPSWFTGDTNRPVEQVSWAEAMAYCAKLTETERIGGRLPASYAYRLPTEAEFEYACRGGSTTRFSFGDDPGFSQLGEHAWCRGNSDGTTHPVGKKFSNAFGLHDMHGNVWEWCLDWYADRYSGGSVVDPIGPASGKGRVFRGGGWDYKNAACRSAFRNHAGPARTFNYVGFRVVLAPELLEPRAN